MDHIFVVHFYTPFKIITRRHCMKLNTYANVAYNDKFLTVKW